MNIPTLKGADVSLAPFGADQITERYLGWLSDPVVNSYSQRSNLPPTSKQDAVRYLENLADNEYILGIHVARLGHVGNIKIGPIDEAKREADISIVIGETSAWGKGVGREAVYLASRYLFQLRNLKRVTAGTANPAFLRLVLSLGWGIEKTEEMTYGNGKDTRPYYSLSISCEDFKIIERLEGDGA